MKYLLDTNVCIQHLRGHPRVVGRLASAAREEVAICSVVCAELFYGAFNSKDPTVATARLGAFLAGMESFPFDDKAAEVAARLRLRLGKAGMPIGPFDLQIAAIALVNDRVLVTHNTGEFSRIAELTTDDWQAG